MYDRSTLRAFMKAVGASLRIVSATEVTDAGNEDRLTYSNFKNVSMTSKDEMMTFSALRTICSFAATVEGALHPVMKTDAGSTRTVAARMMARKRFILE